MPNCAVRGCNSRTDQKEKGKVMFMSFPKDPIYSNIWIQACKSDITTLKNARICSKHFLPAAYKEDFLIRQQLGYPMQRSRILKEDAVPTELLFENTTEEIALSSVQGTSHKNGEIPEETISEDEMDITGFIVNGDEKESEIDWKAEYLKKLEECNNLQKEIEGLQVKNKNLRKIVEKYFTPGQVKILLQKKTKVRWSSEDICSAISLRSVSPRAYRYLKNVKQIPLPGLSTLRKWASTLNVHPGILDDVFMIMKYKGQELSSMERIAVLSFDEMHISNKICLDKSKEKILGPHKAVQVMMVRGLFASWKQIIYFDFDKIMSKEVLLSAINKLDAVGYTVVAIVSDMGGTNASVLRQLNIGLEETQTHFLQHPVKENINIYIFNDVPHIIKLVRNHLLDQGFIVHNKIIDRKCFDNLLKLQAGDFKLAPKLSQYHLDVVGTERQKVKTAVQCLSRTVAQSIKWCGEQGVMQNIDWECASDAILIINDWFDVFNAYEKFHPKMHAYGIDIEKQNNTLDKMSNFIQGMRVGRHKTQIKFQKGILLNNKSLKSLHEDMKNIFGAEYILTYRLNQDVLENFFSYIRGMGATNDHPTPLEFRNRLRWYILGKHSSSVFSENKNAEESMTEICLINLNTATSCITELIGNFAEAVPQNEEEEEEAVLLHIEDFRNLNVDNFMLQQFEQDSENLLAQYKICDEGQKYVAGYIAYRFRNKYTLYEEKNINVTENYDWIHCLSKGKLMHPKQILLDLAKEVETIFLNIHGNGLSKEPYIFKKIINNLNTDLPKEVIACYVRTRTYIRIREINKEQNQKNKERYIARKKQKIK